VITEKISESILDGAAPFFIKERALAFFLTCGLISPERDIFFSKISFHTSISDGSELLKNLFGAVDIFSFSISGMAIFIICPFLNSFLLKLSARLNIKFATPLMDKLEELRNKPIEKIKVLITEQYENIKSDAETNAKKIIELRKLSEIFLIAIFMNLWIYLGTKTYSIPLTGLLFSMWLYSLYKIPRTIILLYLQFISPYNILRDLFSVLVADTSKSTS
jgi:hypothetical protein